MAIARALVSTPKIVLADEPTAALDKGSGRDVVNMMKEMATKEGTTIIMVAHDNKILDEVSSMGYPLFRDKLRSRA